MVLFLCSNRNSTLRLLKDIPELHYIETIIELQIIMILRINDWSIMQKKKDLRFLLNCMMIQCGSTTES